MSVKADGKLSLLRVAVQPAPGRLWIDYAAKAEQRGADMATHLLVSGFTQAPTVELDGKRLDGPFESVSAGGRTAYRIPLQRSP